MIAAAREAGRIALDHRALPREVTHKPDGGGPVTDADLAVNARLEALLRGARPDYGWLSEESPPDPGRMAATRTFVIDPIDGTRAYIDGARDWSHSLAVVEAGETVAACVYLPERDLLYAASKGGGATRNGEAIAPSGAGPMEAARVLTNKGSLRPEYWRGGAAPPFTRHFRSSLAWRLCLVAEGRFDAMITLFPAWDWDIAAGSLIASEAGAQVTDRHGAPLALNAEHPRADGVLTAADALHRAIAGRLA